MESTELRIGNYVSTPNQKYFRIDMFDYVSNGIGKFGQISDTKLHPLTWYLQDLKPIPLTEEILLKCGFKKTEEYYAVYEKNIDVYTIGCFDIAFIDNEYKLWIRIDEDPYYDFTWTKIIYVHQLQNLIFALTGKELEINL